MRILIDYGFIGVNQLYKSKNMANKRMTQDYINVGTAYKNNAFT